jgi:two-component system NtrC family sensor kinase
MSIDLSSFGLTEMLRCRRELHRAASQTPTMETCARRICRTLYDLLQTRDGDHACVLVRCYKTHAFGSLPDDLQRFVRRIGNFVEPPAATMKCLTLLATVGEQAQWNTRFSSRNHQAIPLPSPRIVERAPMIARLIQDFGLNLASIINPTPEVVRDLAGKSYGVFHVEDAAGSPAIPAQDDFVDRYGVKSVVGFGGSLASGDLFAVILFSRVTISAEVADRFRALALDVKSLFFPFGEGTVFDRGEGLSRPDLESGIRA